MSDTLAIVIFFGFVKNIVLRFWIFFLSVGIASKLSDEKGESYEKHKILCKNLKFLRERA